MILLSLEILLKLQKASGPSIMLEDFEVQIPADQYGRRVIVTPENPVTHDRARHQRRLNVGRRQILRITPRRRCSPSARRQEYSQHDLDILK